MAQEFLDRLDNHTLGRELGDIDPVEAWWVEHQEALERAGYMLRPRYRPGWKPSWAGTNKEYFHCEDGQKKRLRVCLDATRISDGRPVMLKKVPIREGPYELQINRLFSTEPLYSNPRNHCVHLLDVIELPNEPPILVHPLLRPYHKPPLRTFGEFVTFFAQICEGVQFMHENHVAHRDCTHGNIMLDPSNMYPGSFHPVRMSRSKDFRHKAKAYSRTRRPSRYLLIDFGLSRHYDPANGPPLDKPLRGGDKSAPEHQDGKALCNPFPTDVYYLGNLVREYFMKKYQGFEFMEPLIADMVQDDPTRRPKVDEVVTRFLEIKDKLSGWKRRSRMVRKDEIWPLAVWRSFGHWYRTIGYALGRKAAIPDPE
ncbi:kinase-like domain-containing protein [Russula ochroleuca]|uniref:Kinase-like domain-containing protein n=1 Tax=Russula ochroleuca TaxID=152965 RepID=A0A9P5MR59_9AGAM|nr:kinase-like domain-containing protein [Russula ochroleuca]